MTKTLTTTPFPSPKVSCWCILGSARISEKTFDFWNKNKSGGTLAFLAVGLSIVMRQFSETILDCVEDHAMWMAACASCLRVRAGCMQPGMQRADKIDRQRAATHVGRNQNSCDVTQTGGTQVWWFEGPSMALPFVLIFLLAACAGSHALQGTAPLAC